MRKIRRGMIVGVEFLDHVKNGMTPIRFIVYGRIARITRISISIDTWCYASSKFSDQKGRQHNIERYTIVRSAVLKIHILKEEK